MDDLVTRKLISRIIVHEDHQTLPQAAWMTRSIIVGSGRSPNIFPLLYVSKKLAVVYEILASLTINSLLVHDILMEQFSTPNNIKAQPRNINFLNISHWCHRALGLVSVRLDNNIKVIVVDHQTMSKNSS
ncbi:hypothetical protein BOTCAL_0496g00040 [Botryotinia calthae]|uniref:Uncharacterized protein n=1 Tax=Botryotinia calthae TaxID=38488 RepID=A0A4Y8CMA0_9HELO|nr:hypothetical protein BOTCAL_0496g00040 [Botryotinia calthae]